MNFYSILLVTLGNIFQYHNSMFYKRRENRIESRARDMSSWPSIEMKRQVCLAFETYKDIPCFGVNWVKANSIEVFHLCLYFKNIHVVMTG